MDDIILKITSKYSLEELKRFSKHHFYHSKSIIFTTIVDIFLLIYAIFTLYTGSMLSILAAAIAVVWFLELLLLPGIQAKKGYKSSKLKDATISANFYEDRVELETIKDKDVVSTSKMKIEDFTRVVDTKTNMYLYITTNQAFCLSKDGMDGDYAKVTSILKEKLGKNYINRNK